MNYADIKRIDVANGPGVRVSLFVSGCPHHCKNCFNEETWDYNFGMPFTENEINEILEYMNHDFIRGITVLGGEPLAPQNQSEVLHVLREVKNHYPDKSIWLFTGYLFDRDVLGKMRGTLPETEEILELVDVVVDGPFIEELKNLNLKFKGSSNQRTIMVKESLRTGEVVLWNEDPTIDK